MDWKADALASRRAVFRVMEAIGVSAPNGMSDEDLLKMDVDLCAQNAASSIEKAWKLARKRKKELEDAEARAGIGCEQEACGDCPGCHAAVDYWKTQ